MPKNKPRKSLVPAGEAPPPKRNAKGQWLPGFSGSMGTDAPRARRTLNLSTIQAMQKAFDKGGQAAVDKVMKTQPAIFLKLCVLLVPRELEVTQAGGVKALSDQQIEAAIEAIQASLARRAGDGAIDVTPAPGEGVAEDASATKD